MFASLWTITCICSNYEWASNMRPFVLHVGDNTEMRSELRIAGTNKELRTMLGAYVQLDIVRYRHG